MADLSHFTQLAKAERMLFWTLLFLDVLYFTLAFGILYWLGRFIKALEQKWLREYELQFSRREAESLNAPFKR